jgi:hypothetical protein
LGDCPTDQVLSALGLAQSELTIEPFSQPAPPSQESPAFEQKRPKDGFSFNGVPASSASKFKHAIAYARRGFLVFPCHNIDTDGECSCGKLQCASAGKHPRYKDWQKDATLDEAQIRRWWSEYPDSNIGVACGAKSKLTVLDVDGQTGRDTLRQLELDNGELPETPIALTGSGGAHYYFLHSPGVGNAVRFAPGLDIRTDGGLVVGVGSVTKNPYRWEVQAPLGEVPLGVMPTWLAGLIKVAQTPQTNGERFKLPNLDQMVEGSGRQEALYKAIRSMRLQGLAEQAIREIAASINQRMKRPLDPSEFRLTIEHALSQPDREGFVPAVANGHLPVVLPVEGFEAAQMANEEYLKRDAIVEGLCYARAVSMITGGKHAGKSTLARWLAICLAKGISFLDREVQQGEVLYLASEDETMAARMELLRLGWTPSDPIKFMSMSNITVDQVKLLEALTDYIRNNIIKLVVMDMLFDFVSIGDEMSYAQTREALGKIQMVASAGGCHIVTVHHAPKHANHGDAAIAALGSQGLAARVSPLILVRRHGPGVHSVVTTEVRDPRGKSIVESRLTKGEDGSMRLTGPFKNYMLAEVYSPRVLDMLQAEPGSEHTAPELAGELDVPYEIARACLSNLWKNGVVSRTGTGKRGRPFRYSIPLTDLSQANGGSEDAQNPSVGGIVGINDPEKSTSNLESQGRFGYKETAYPDDLDEHGISRSK